MFIVSKDQKDEYARIAGLVVDAHDPKQKCKELGVRRTSLITGMRYCTDYEIYPKWEELITGYVNECKEQKKQKMIEKLKKRTELRHEQYVRISVIVSVERVMSDKGVDSIVTIAKEFMEHENRQNVMRYAEHMSIYRSEFPEIYENIVKKLPMKSAPTN